MCVCFLVKPGLADGCLVVAGKGQDGGGGSTSFVYQSAEISKEQ